MRCHYHWRMKNTLGLWHENYVKRISWEMKMDGKTYVVLKSLPLEYFPGITPTLNFCHSHQKIFQFVRFLGAHNFPSDTTDDRWYSRRQVCCGRRDTGRRRTCTINPWGGRSFSSYVWSLRGRRRLYQSLGASVGYWQTLPVHAPRTDIHCMLERYPFQSAQSFFCRWKKSATIPG